MKNIGMLVMFSTFLFTACAATAGREAGLLTDVPSTQPAKNMDSGWEVKVTRNGVELASYRQTIGRGAGALFDGKLIQMYLASPDNKHVLTVDIQGAKPGVYPLAIQYEPAKPGEARLNFMTGDPPALIPAIGEVKLDEFSETSCSGSFKGTGNDIRGAKFSIEGSFSNLTVEKHE